MVKCTFFTIQQPKPAFCRLYTRFLIREQSFFFIFCGIIVTIYVRGGKQLTDIMIADTVGTVDMIRKTILGYTSNKKSLREVLKR